MKSTIANPSIIALAFNRRDERFDKFKKDANKLGIVIRELIPIDIQIPIDEKYNDAMNFIKQNTSPILNQFVKADFPFKDTIFKAIEKKMRLKLLTNVEDFKKSNYYPYGYLGLTPVFADLKYLDGDYFETQEEKDNYSKLFSMKSDGYKPLITPTKNEEDFKKFENSDFDMLNFEK